MRCISPYATLPIEEKQINFRYSEIKKGDVLSMIDPKMETLLMVAKLGSFTKAGEILALTQPAVSNHIRQLEQKLGVRLVLRNNGSVTLTDEGKIVVKYARRMQALDTKMLSDLQDCAKRLTRIRIGITHTAESNVISEILAKYSNEHSGVIITIITNTIKKLYGMLDNYELDMAIVEERPNAPELKSLLLDTDCLVCVVSTNNPLARRSMVTLEELKGEKMILRRPGSATRIMFEAQLESISESIDDFDVILEVDNIATIKDLIRKDLGVSILPKSTCADELRKKKLAALQVENLSMVRETNIIYHRDFSHIEILREILTLYRESEHE